MSKNTDYLSSAINEQPTLLCKFNKLMELITKENYFAPMKKFKYEFYHLELIDENNRLILLPRFSFYSNTEYGNLNDTSIAIELFKEYIGYDYTTYLICEFSEESGITRLCRFYIDHGVLKVHISDEGSLSSYKSITQPDAYVIKKTNLYDGSVQIGEL